MAGKAGDPLLAENESGEGIIDTCFLDSLVGYWLRRASNVMAADFSRAVQDAGGLRSVQVSILAIAGSNPGISQTQLGRTLNIQRANMVPLLSSLIDSGLICRKASPEDKRVFELYLTEAGQAKLDEAKTLILAHEKRLLAALTTGERRALIEFLAKITAAGAE